MFNLMDALFVSFFLFIFMFPIATVDAGLVFDGVCGLKTLTSKKDFA